MNPAPLARLLIVDDESAQVIALCRTLEFEGYATTGAGSGPEALAVLRTAAVDRASPFDVLITDLMMPDMDGIALLRAAQETDPDLVGLVMTGHGTIDTAVEAMKSGALDYILKPFNLRTILPVLSRALGVRRLRLRPLIRRRLLTIEEPPDHPSPGSDRRQCATCNSGNSAQVKTDVAVAAATLDNQRCRRAVVGCGTSGRHIGVIFDGPLRPNVAGCHEKDRQ